MQVHQAIGVFLLLLCASSQARPVLWTLDNVRFDDGASLSGSFIYDGATDAYTSVSMHTEGGGQKGFDSPAEYGLALDEPTSYFNFGGVVDVPCRDGLCRRKLKLLFPDYTESPPDGEPPDFRSSDLPDEGGTVHLLPGSYEVSIGKRSYQRDVIGGSLTGTVMPLANIEIDVQPQDPANFIDTSGDFRNKISVAILSTNTADGDVRDFDALQVDAATVTFGPGRAQVDNHPGVVSDVDGDGDPDLELEFMLGFSQIVCEQADDVTLIGLTASGDAVIGVNSVTTPECPGCHP